MTNLTQNTISVLIRPESKGRKFVVEMDRDRLERLASDFGLFSPDFLKSLERAEQEIARGKTKRLRTLRILR